MGSSRDCLPALSVVESPIEGRLVSTMFGQWEFCHYLELCRTDLTAKIAALFETKSGPLAVFLQVEHVNLPRRRVDIIVEPMAGQLIVEIDGLKHHSDQVSMIEDREKDRAALIAGFYTVRFTGKDVWDNPEKCVREVQSAAARMERDKQIVQQFEIDRERARLFA